MGQITGNNQEFWLVHSTEGFSYEGGAHVSPKDPMFLFRDLASANARATKLFKDIVDGYQLTPEFVEDEDGHYWEDEGEHGEKEFFMEYQGPDDDGPLTVSVYVKKLKLEEDEEGTKDTGTRKRRKLELTAEEGNGCEKDT